MSKVTKIFTASNDGRLMSPEDAINVALKDLKEGNPLENCKKMLIIPLMDGEDNYDVGFIQAGMSLQQCITLLEVVKTIMLAQMGYPVFFDE